MSRAFVRESDQDNEPLPERQVSEHPNLVTPSGLQKIEEQIRALENERQAARAADDKTALARVARDLRYWTQRRATARVIEPVAAPDAIRFGVEAWLRFDDGSERSFRLVGEDEADPANGLVSWVSPLGKALIGRVAGDEVEALGSSAEIVRLAS